MVDGNVAEEPVTKTNELEIVETGKTKHGIIKCINTILGSEDWATESLGYTSKKRSFGFLFSINKALDTIVEY